MYIFSLAKGVGKSPPSPVHQHAPARFLLPPCSPLVLLPLLRQTQTAQPLVPAPKANEIKQVPLSQLFHFADGWDWLLMFGGTGAGIATGVAMPVRTLFSLVYTCMHV